MNFTFPSVFRSHRHQPDPEIAAAAAGLRQASNALREQTKTVLVGSDAERQAIQKEADDARARMMGGRPRD